MPSQTNPPASATSSVWAGASSLVKSAPNKVFATSATGGTASNDVLLGYGAFSLPNGATNITVSVPLLEASTGASSDTVNLYLSPDGVTKTWGPFAASGWPSSPLGTNDYSVTPPSLATATPSVLQCQTGLYLIVELPTGASGIVALDFMSLEIQWTGSTPPPPPPPFSGKDMSLMRHLNVGVSDL